MTQALNFDNVSTRLYLQSVNYFKLHFKGFRVASPHPHFISIVKDPKKKFLAEERHGTDNDLIRKLIAKYHILIMDFL